MPINTRRRSSINGLIVDIPEDTPNPNCPKEMCESAEEPQPPEEFTLTVESLPCAGQGDEIGVSINSGPFTAVTASQDFQVTEGDIVELLAAPEGDDTFLNWQDISAAVLSTDNPYIFNAIETQNYVAGQFECPATPEFLIAPLSVNCLGQETDCPDGVINLTVSFNPDGTASYAWLNPFVAATCDPGDTSPVEFNWFTNAIDPADYEIIVQGTEGVEFGSTGEVSCTDVNGVPTIATPLDTPVQFTLDACRSGGSPGQGEGSVQVFFNATIEIREIATSNVVATETLSFSIEHSCVGV